MCVKIEKVLNTIMPKLYYQKELNGNLGMHTSSGWHRTHALCPFHNDKRPGTFNVNVRTGKFKCFSCGAHGDVLDFHKQKYGMDTKTAVQELWRAHR